MRKRLVGFAALVLSVTMLTGCPIDAPKVRDSIATAYGFIGDLQTKHLAECKATPTLQTCVLINKGIAVQRLAASALNDYCSGPPAAGDMPYATGGPCSAQAGLADRLNAALTDLNNVMGDLKKLK